MLSFGGKGKRHILVSRLILSFLAKFLNFMKKLKFLSKMFANRSII